MSQAEGGPFFMPLLFSTGIHGALEEGTGNGVGALCTTVRILGRMCD